MVLLRDKKDKRERTFGLRQRDKEKYGWTFD